MNLRSTFRPGLPLQHVTLGLFTAIAACEEPPPPPQIAAHALAESSVHDRPAIRNGGRDAGAGDFRADRIRSVYRPDKASAAKPPEDFRAERIQNVYRATSSPTEPGDFREQRLRKAEPAEKVDYTAAEIVRLYHDNPRIGWCGFGNKWLHFAWQPHSTATIAALRQVFEQSENDELRLAVLRSLTSDEHPELPAFWRGLEARSDFSDDWLPSILNGLLHTDRTAATPWLLARVGRSPAWNAALVGAMRATDAASHLDLPDAALEKIYGDPQTAVSARVDTLCVLLGRNAHRAPRLADEALRAPEPEIVSAGIRCVTPPPSPARLEPLLASAHFQVRGVAASRLLEAADAKNGAEAARLTLRLLGTGDPTLRYVSSKWWVDAIELARWPHGAQYEESVEAQFRGSSEVLLNAVKKRQPSVMRRPELLLRAGFLTELRGDFDGAVALYRRALALGPEVLTEAENELIEDYPGELRLRLVRILLAQGRAAQAEPYLREMETRYARQTVESGLPFNEYSGGAAEVAERIRKERARPLRFHVAAGRDRKSITLKFVNVGREPIAIVLNEREVDDGAKPRKPIPVYTMAYAAGYEVASVAGQRERPVTVEIAPSKSHTITVPADLSRLPRHYMLNVVADVEVKWPRSMSADDQEDRLRLEALAEVR